MALCFVALSPISACTSQSCLSCDCVVDTDCLDGFRCEVSIGVCIEACDAHDDCGEGTRCAFSTGECTNIDACTSNDDCTNFTVCDLDERLCGPDACSTDEDCELEEAPRCDVDEGVCVAGATNE